MYTKKTMTATLLTTLLAGTTLAAGPGTGDKAADRDSKARETSPYRQTDRNSNTPRDGMARDRSRQQTNLSFEKASVLMGADVTNASEDSLGSVNDFIVDRGSGAIKFAIITEGGFLGFGGDRVAIPFSELKFDKENDTFLLNRTPEQLENMREFTPDSWHRLDGSDAQRTIEKAQNNSPWDDAYGSAITNAGQTERVRGEVTRVDRERAANGQEEVVVTVKTVDGNTQRVVLGPSWHVMSLDQPPYRGDTINVTAYKLSNNSEYGTTGDRTNNTERRTGEQPDRNYDRRDQNREETPRTGGDQNRTNDRTNRTTSEPNRTTDGNANRMADKSNPANTGHRQGRLVAQSFTINGETSRLRGDDGTPAWSNDSSAGGLNAQDRLPAFVLMSDIIGMPVHARGEQSGEIQDAVVELSTGRIALFGLDPNENFLGVGDTIRSVPWSIAGIGSEAVNIDADKTMLESSPQFPDDVSVFANDRDREPIYTSYLVDMYMFVPADNDANWGERVRDGENNRDRYSNDRDNRDVRDRDDMNRDGAQRPAGDHGGKNGMGHAYDRTEHGRKELIDAVNNARATRIRGEYAGMTTIVVPGNGTMQAVIVRTSDGTKTVALAPESYTKKSDLSCKDGEQLDIQARQVELGNYKVFVATELNHADGKKLTLWEGDQPVWNEG